MEGYKWKLEGLGKGVDVALVVEELTRLQKVNRILTPEVVVRAAEDNNSIRRRRVCDECEKRFTTYEKIETIPLIIEWSTCSGS